MKRYAKFGCAAPFRFRVILEKPQGGGGKMTPPPTRAKVKAFWQEVGYMGRQQVVKRCTSVAEAALSGLETGCW